MRKFICALLLCFTTGMASAQLVINELMQSNIDCIMDDLNEFPDSWVELYNAGSTAVNLGDYSIGITDADSEAWQLPSETVQPGQWTIVYCDKEGSGKHTPYRLESGKGCAVYLFKGGEVADQVSGLKKQPAPNIAYGRKTDGADDWGYQLTPTPGKANCGKTSKDVLGEPVFNKTGGIFAAGKRIRLVLSLPEGAPEGTEIRYTTDGKEPTAASTLYQNAIWMEANGMVRAKLFCDGYLSPRSTTHSYIFFPTDRELTLPVVSIVTDGNYLYDPAIGIYVEGNKADGKNNYEHDWRRPINFEYFEGMDTPSLLNQLCETRIQGGATRSNMRKSLAVYANKRFGEKRLKYEFFPDQKPGLTDFKSIVLRNSGNDFDYLFMRDAVIQRTMAAHTDLDWQAWRPVIVYLNGQYTGMLNIRERSNEDNIYTNYDGLEDLDMIENWWELKEGTWDNWNQFKDFYAEHGHTLAEYEQWIDWREFINLMVMNLYYHNQDFPGNNIVMWRPRTEGGLWRFIAKDTDFGLALYSYSDNDAHKAAAYNTIEWLYNPNYDSNRNWGNQYEYTRLFRRMMEDKDFNREFIDRSAIYMGDFMNYQGTHEIWDPMYEMIKTEYPHHRKLINEWWPNYNNEIRYVNIFLSERTDNFYKYLANYYKLGQPTALRINNNTGDEELAAISVSFNGVPLSKGVFDGKFFANRIVTLEATATEGYEVTAWELLQVDNNGTVTQTTQEGATCTFTMPECQQLLVNAVVEDCTGIYTPRKTCWKHKVEGSRLLLSGIPQNERVSLYDTRGMLLSTTIANGADISFPLPTNKQMYILKVGTETRKLK